MKFCVVIVMRIAKVSLRCGCKDSTMLLQEYEEVLLNSLQNLYS